MIHSCPSFKYELSPLEQLSKDEEETDLVPEKANDLKPDVLKSDVDIACSEESAPVAFAEDTGGTFIHESDHEGAACDISLVDNEGTEDKINLGSATGRQNLAEKKL